LKIDYISDLHMEINGNLRLEWPKEKADILVLVGDIICYRFFEPHRTDSEARSIKKRFNKFVKEDCADYKHIYFVPGNHEYYGLDHVGADTDFKKRLSEIDSRCKLLQNDISTHDDVIIFGATLWTDMKNNDPLVKMVVGNGMNDFRLISNSNTNKEWTTDDAIQEHHYSMDSMKHFYHNRNDKKFVVFTHHAPCMLSHDVNRFGINDDMKYGYITELSDWIMDTDIKNWIHGHTHFNVSYMIGDCLVKASMHGYLGYDKPRKHTQPVGQIIV